MCLMLFPDFWLAFWGVTLQVATTPVFNLDTASPAWQMKSIAQMKK